MNRGAIWIINQYGGTPYHGMVFRSYYVALALIKKGYSVYVFSASYTHLLINPPNCSQNFSHEKIDGINYIWTKVQVYKKSKSLKRALSLITFPLRLLNFDYKSIEQPKVIVVSSPSPTPVFVAHKWAQKLNAQLFFEVRDLWSLSMTEVGGVSDYNPYVLLMKLSENFAYRKAKKVISLLPDAKKIMVKKGLKEEKFLHIPNAIYEHSQDLIELPDQIVGKIPKDKFIVGYSGTLGIANSIDHLIRAAQLLKSESNIVFLLVGTGGEMDILQNLALGLNNVIFLGHIEKKYIASVIKCFNVCYIGLVNQNLFQYGVSPNKLFDYMISAKPIIYSINSSNNYVRDSGCGIVVEPENSEAIASAVRKFSVMSSDELFEIGELGRDFVIKNFTYDIIIEKYVKAIENVYP
ncbi:MAG: glycosyltransferase family 4 protein [Ignavibacteriaceae bacterium]|nr:glycosyltransferase family 4 protein [Ignavibacteriaceae bacterium]